MLRTVDFTMSMSTQLALCDSSRTDGTLYKSKTRHIEYKAQTSGAQ